MITLRTSTRLTLAVLSVSLGATVALAADKKPSKPAKANAPAVVQKTHTPAITSPRDVASRQATGRTRQPQQFSMQALVTNEQIKRKPTKQLNSGGGVSAQNDAGTRNGTSLALEGMIDMVKGMGKVLSPKGNTHEGLEQTSKGWAKVKTGSNGDPSDNGPKLNDEGNSNGNNNGNNNNNNGNGSGGNGSSGGTGDSTGK